MNPFNNFYSKAIRLTGLQSFKPYFKLLAQILCMNHGQAIKPAFLKGEIAFQG